MRLAFTPYTLNFKEPAGTSRGVLHSKLTYLIKVYDEREPERFGIGEAPLFQGLSAEDNDRYEFKLIELLANVALGRGTVLSHHSSIMFGFEQALRDFTGGCKHLYYPSQFTSGESEIVINGLIWMGSFEEMQKRVEQKIEQGFQCIKLKIGAIDWRSEIALIEEIRKRFSPDTLTLRVDANGAFCMENALARMDHLYRLGVHSIEQPIRQGYPELMAFLCSVSPLPIALDEELIGVYGRERKEALLDEIKPAYIILKPALCGGFSGAEEWIEIAEQRGIGWWATSALESNIGLNALAQWCGTKNLKIPQGLGTGALYTNNFPTPLTLEGENLKFDVEYASGGYITDLEKSLAELPWRE